MNKNADQLLQENKCLEFRVATLKETINRMANNRFKSEIDYDQQIKELIENNIILRRSLKCAELKVIVLQDQANKCSEHHPSVHNMQATSPAVEVVVNGMVINTSTLGQTTANSRSGQAAAGSDEVFLKDGCLAHNLDRDHEDDDDEDLISPPCSPRSADSEGSDDL